MQTVLDYLKSVEWSWNGGGQCIDCHGKNPAKWRPGPRLGHQPGCKLGPAIAVVEKHLAPKGETANRSLDEPTIPFPEIPTPLQDYGESLSSNDNDF